ncbi:hypothetical protein ACLOJK_013862 [Asimina triloba]
MASKTSSCHGNANAPAAVFRRNGKLAIWVGIFLRASYSKMKKQGPCCHCGIKKSFQALHYGGMGHLASLCCVMHVDQDGGPRVRLQAIFHSMHSDFPPVTRKTAAGILENMYHEPSIPSRKRTSFECHSPSPVEKLRRELVSILQEQESSCPSQFSEEVLLFENQDPMVSVETSLGSLLIKHQVTSVEESQASSLTKENEASCLNDSSMVSSPVQVPFQGCEVSSSSGDKDRMRRNLGEGKDINEPAAKRRALASLFLENSLLGHPCSMTMPRNCSSTDILLQNVSTARLSVPRPLTEQLPMMRPLSSMDPTILAPGRDSVVLNPMNAKPVKPFCEVSLTSASDASSLLQVPFEMERLCRMNRPK